MRILVQIIAFFVLALPASAQITDNVAEADLLAGWRTESGSHMAALRIRLAPGWKTYWRAPGEGGIPPRFDWSGSQNIESVRLHWPTPEVFTVNGIRNIGYVDELILPIEFTPRRVGRAIQLNTQVEIGVCETVCIPMQFSIRAELPTSGEHYAGAIRQALRQRPINADRAGVGAVRCAAEPISDGLSVTARIELPRMAGREVVVFELPDQSIWISPADVSRTGGTLSATADFVPPASQPFALNRSDLRITVIGNGIAADIRGCSG